MSISCNNLGLYNVLLTAMQAPTQAGCISITCDFDKVKSNSHLSEKVDRLPTGKKLNLLLQGFFSAAQAGYKALPFTEPCTHQLLSSHLEM